MEIKEFYIELYSKLKEILNPYHFRKKGDRFRCFLDNGIAWEIEIQRNELKIANLFSFTVNIHIGLVSTQKPYNFWNVDISQLSGNLGDKIDGRWDNQKWYNLSAMVNSQVKAQIKDGKLPLTYQEPGKEIQTIQIPIQTFDEIIEEICGLIEYKVIPFYLTVQTLDEYTELLKTGREKGVVIFASTDIINQYADILGKPFLPVLGEWIKASHISLEYLLSQDVSRYDDIYIQSHDKLVASQKEQLVFMEEVAEKLQE